MEVTCEPLQLGAGEQGAVGHAGGRVGQVDAGEGGAGADDAGEGAVGDEVAAADVELLERARVKG